MIPIRPTPRCAAQGHPGLGHRPVAGGARQLQVARDQRRADRLADRPEVRRRHAAGGRGWPVRSVLCEQAEQLRRGRDRGRQRGRRSRLRHGARRASQPVQGQGLVVAGRQGASDDSRASTTRTASTPSSRRTAYFGGWDGWKDAIQGATTLPAGVTIDAFGRNPDRYRGVAKVDTARFFQLLDEEVIRPVADAAAMLYQGALPHAPLQHHEPGRDDGRSGLRLQHRSRAGQQRPHRQAVHPVRSDARTSTTRHGASKLPQGGVIVGKGGGWPVAAGSMPANLKIVQLSTTGSGTVVKDNSDDIGMKLVQDRGHDRRRHRDAPSAAERRDDRRHADRDAARPRPARRRGRRAAPRAATGAASRASAPARARRSRCGCRRRRVILALRRRRRRCGARSRGAGGAGES